MAEPHALEAFFGPPNKAVDPLAPHEAFCGHCEGFADTIIGMVTREPMLVKTRVTAVDKAERLAEIANGTPGGPYVRYGLAFMLEEGFEKTEQGRAAYTHNVEQIRKRAARHGAAGRAGRAAGGGHAPRRGGRRRHGAVGGAPAGTVRARPADRSLSGAGETRFVHACLSASSARILSADGMLLSTLQRLFIP